MEMTVTVDGSALGSPGLAGWAWLADENNWPTGGWSQATNNRGELMAVTDFLEASAVFPEITAHLLCDSQYVINSVTKQMPGRKRCGWRKADGKPILNSDLVKCLDALLADRRVRFKWVKGHAGHPMNERTDDLARAAATAFQARRQPVVGPGLGVLLASRGVSPDSGVNSGDAESGSAGSQPTLLWAYPELNRFGSALVIQIRGGKTWLKSVVCFSPPRSHEVPSGKLTEVLQAAPAGFPHSRAEWFEVRHPIGIRLPTEYHLVMEATLDKAGRPVIPKVFHDQLGFSSGTPVDISSYGNGLQITPGGRKASPKAVAGKSVAASEIRLDDDLVYTLMDSVCK